MDQLTDSGFFPYRPAALLRIEGSDAANFLQGQFTNDLRGSEKGLQIYGLWLNQKGRVLADSFVCKNGPEAFLVCSYFSNAAVIRERLEHYVIADDVTIEDVTATWAAVSILGPNTERLSPRVVEGAVTFRGRRTQQGNMELLFPREREDQVNADLSAAGLFSLSMSQMEKLRIENGVPAVPQDIGPTELPNEGGLETTAISFTKGCYLGQEVMARLKSMGQVRRKLLRVEGGGEEVPPLPAPLFSGERKVGELRSAAPNRADGFVGLALLSLMHVKSGSALSFAPGNVPRVRVIDELPSP